MNWVRILLESGQNEDKLGKKPSAPAHSQQCRLSKEISACSKGSISPHFGSTEAWFIAQLLFLLVKYTKLFSQDLPNSLKRNTIKFEVLLGKVMQT